MPENATDLLKKAVAAKVAERVAALRQAPTVKAEDGHSYKLVCSGCGASNQFTDSDLPNYRTDPETSLTSDDDPENDPDDPEEEESEQDDPELDDDEFEDRDRAARLARSLLKAAKKNSNK